MLASWRGIAKKLFVKNFFKAAKYNALFKTVLCIEIPDEITFKL